MKRYYAFEFAGVSERVSGEPNKKTGRYNMNGSFKVFTSRKERDCFVIYNKKLTIAVNRKELRELHLGLTNDEFEDKLYMASPQPF